jgi:hypothetical protein
MRDAAESEAQLVVEERFAIVPEWLLDADIGDCAVRLYAALLRYGNSSGARMPGRATLARRLRKRSTDTVDRAMRELVAVGAVRVEHRYAGRQRLTNRYHVQTSRPGSPAPGTDVSPEGGRTDAATRTKPGGGDRAGAPTGGRVRATGVAARIGQDRQHWTQSTHHPSPDPSHGPSSWSVRKEAMLGECGVDDWPALIAEVQDLRQEAGGSLGRWQEQHLLAAIELSVRGKGWPAELAARALRQVAADPTTRSPARVAQAGPWWDKPIPAAKADLEAMVADLEASDGRRVLLQRQARAQLEAEGRPVTRASVVRRAHALLRNAGRGAAAS